MSVENICSVVHMYENEVLCVRSYVNYEDAEKHVEEQKRMDEIDGHTELFSYEIHRSYLFDKY